MRNGCSQAGIDQVRERNVNVVKTLKGKDGEVQNQIQYMKIRKGKCNERYKLNIWGEREEVEVGD